MDLQQLTERTGAICQEVAAFIREEAPRLTEAGVSSKVSDATSAWIGAKQ